MKRQIIICCVAILLVLAGTFAIFQQQRIAELERENTALRLKVTAANNEMKSIEDRCAARIKLCEEAAAKQSILREMNDGQPDRIQSAK